MSKYKSKGANCQYSLTLQIFYVDLTVLQTFPWIILFASYPLYDKSFHIDSNHTSFEKKTIFFSKTQILYVSRNLIISVALYGWKMLKHESGHWRQVWQYQLAKREKKRSISDLSGWFTFHFYNWARKLVRSSESKKRNGQHLNGNLTMP